VEITVGQVNHTLRQSQALGYPAHAELWVQRRPQQRDRQRWVTDRLQQRIEFGGQLRRFAMTLMAIECLYLPGHADGE
jgi:hypothetical protein